MLRKYKTLELSAYRESDLRDAQCHTLAGTVLEQEARPEADPVGRVGEQPRHRGRRHFQGRRCAVAIPAPPGTDDPACVGLDFDLDDGRGTLAVRHVGLRATGTHPRILRADCALRFVPRARAAACGHGRRRRAAGRACARSGASPAARSCARRAPSTTRSQSREAWQAALPGSRSGPATPARPCAAGRPPCVATRSCCACSTRCRLVKGVFPAAPLPPGRKARPSPRAGPPSSPRRPPSACSGRCRAATSANPPGHGNPPPPGAVLPRALAPRPPAPAPSPRGYAPVRTETASRAARTPTPPWGATRSRRPPRPASGLPHNPRRASTCARR